MTERHDEVVLDVQELFAGYSATFDVIRGVNLLVRRGEIVCIIGPNGAGKSTLIKAILGFVPVRAGAVFVNGRDTTGSPPHQLVRQGVGYVPQNADVFSDLTVEDNLTMGSMTKRSEHRSSADRVYDWFPVLAQRRRERAGSLSGGQRRLLGIGRALMTSADLLLLDEPSAGLSPGNVYEVFERLSEVRDNGVAMAMVEQNAVEGLALADIGYVLDQGTEALSGAADSLLADPRVRDLYLGLKNTQTGGGEINLR